MKRTLLRLFAFQTIFFVMVSCNNSKESARQEGKISAQKDGSFLLKLDDAACYSDESNPSGNTAEWTFIVLNAGRYKVWLSSATKDTIHLGYSGSVKISLLDNHIEKIPECDTIIRNTNEVSYPYFRTDSYMGSFYFPEPGDYNIQVISEKVIAKESGSQNSSQSEDTKLMSLILIPMTR
jgi:hypothetical protein